MLVNVMLALNLFALVDIGKILKISLANQILRHCKLHSHTFIANTNGILLNKYINYPYTPADKMMIYVS